MTNWLGSLMECSWSILRCINLKKRPVTKIKPRDLEQVCFPFKGPAFEEHVGLHAPFEESIENLCTFKCINESYI